MSQPLLGVSLVDLLECDPRPSFVVDLSISSQSPTAAVIYSNPAAAQAPSLCELFSPDDGSEHSNTWWRWVRGEDLDAPRSHSYLDFAWTRAVVRGTWAVLSATDLPPSDKLHKQRQEASRDIGILQSRGSAATGPAADDDQAPRLARATTDATLSLPDGTPEKVPFFDVVLSVDWAATPLGSMDKWSKRLHQTVSQVISDSRPIAIYWGHELITIYNEAFGKLCGTKHPGLLGKPVGEAWPYAAEKLLGTIQTTIQRQRASGEEESRFFIENADGPPQETYLQWSIIPILDDHKCLGVMQTVLETTGVRLWERRMKMLIEMGERLVTARDTKSYWKKTIEELESCDPAYDIPLAILYSVDDEGDDRQTLSPHDCNKICRLEGALGVPEGHPLIPDVLRLRSSDGGLSNQFREALRNPQPVVVQVKDGTLQPELLPGLQWRGFGDPCTSAVVLPIKPTREENVMGLMVLWLNPRRPYDNDYQQYISLLSQKLTTSLASTVLLEEEARRGRNAEEQAAYDQALLEEKLALQISAVTESEHRFKAVAEFIPVGMCFGDSQANITFANDSWYRITGHPPGPVPDGGFLSCVVDQDRASLTKAYAELQEDRTAIFEFRVKRKDEAVPEPRTSPSFGNPALAELGLEPTAERHVLAMAKAERAPDGSIIRVLTCLTDVTEHKKTAEEAIKRAQQAEKLKRMAEFATVGMYDMDFDGHLLSANRIFFEMCGLEVVDPATQTVLPWQTCVVEEDQAVLKRSLSLVLEQGRIQTAEFRLQRPWITEDAHGNEVKAPRWVQSTFLPVADANGQIVSFAGCISDVSLHKWQLERERLRKEQALESKRQQENFIDMTSHEMRNPLSAIIHCADAIIASLTKTQEDPSYRPVPSLALPGLNAPEDPRGLRGTLVGDSIDNAETILACAQHQTRIVDDILTMSKLDSKLLTVAPTTVNPVAIVQEALKMFEVEARRVDIDLTMVVDRSYDELGHVYLDFDPSRVKQVLINLLTNALKFTKAVEARNVSVCVKASTTRPTETTSGVQFIPRTTPEPGLGQPRNPGRDGVVYLLFEVKDTGQGLSDEEKLLLFNRFVQATSRTHVKYGGSGLGLFISRRLTELQNGAIGVSSKPGVGSTFAFFIEASVPSEAARREAEAAARVALPSPASPTATNGDRAAGEQRQVSLRPKVAPTNPELDGILVVEDNLINQQITRRALLARGFSVVVANHGLEAIDLLLASVDAPTTTDIKGTKPTTSTPMRINLILMDIEMPIQDGLSCTKSIRELERQGMVFGSSGGRIPIIAVSANARAEQREEAKAAGVDDVLVKPYRMHDLFEKMQDVMQLVKRPRTE